MFSIDWWRKRIGFSSTTIPSCDMALSSESPKIQGVRKEFPPRDNKLGKENRHHRRTQSCTEKFGLVRPLAERQPNHFPYVDKVVKCDGASPDHLAAPSDGSFGSGRGSNKLSTLNSSKNSTEQRKNKVRVTSPQPFRLLTERRGQMKEQQFMIKLQQQMDEEEKLRIPIAQWLPLTTDKPQVLPKPPVKEKTKQLNVKLHTESRAVERAEFDQFMDKKLSYLEQQKLEELRIQKRSEEEEIKRLREEMIPYAQVMPVFDQQFIPKKSSKPLTVPKEPNFHCHRRTRSYA